MSKALGMIPRRFFVLGLIAMSDSTDKSFWGWSTLWVRPVKNEIDAINRIRTLRGLNVIIAGSWAGFLLVFAGAGLHEDGIDFASLAISAAATLLVVIAANEYFSWQRIVRDNRYRSSDVYAVAVAGLIPNVIFFFIVFPLFCFRIYSVEGPSFFVCLFALFAVGMAYGVMKQFRVMRSCWEYLNVSKKMTRHGAH